MRYKTRKADLIRSTLDLWSYEKNAFSLHSIVHMESFIYPLYKILKQPLGNGHQGKAQGTLIWEKHGIYLQGT